MEFRLLLFGLIVSWLPILQTTADVVTCGDPVIPPHLPRIVGGSEATIGSWPWMAMLVLDGVQVCGGSILNEHFILSAAHCFNGEYRSNPSHWLVYVGKHHIHKVDSGQSGHHINEIIKHEAYNNDTLENDIVLLLLQEPIHYQDHVMPVCIPPTSRRVVLPGETCYTTGWGDTLGSGSRYVLNQVPLPIIRRYYCAKWYPTHFKPNVSFCAGYISGGRDACDGDSGGPFVCEVGGTWYQQGVVSWGHGCAQYQQPGVYTDVSKYGKWIRSHMADRGFPIII